MGFPVENTLRAGSVPATSEPAQGRVGWGWAWQSSALCPCWHSDSSPLSLISNSPSKSRLLTLRYKMQR